MQEQDNDEDRSVNRRRLLRRAGTVAAGVAGAGVVSAVVSSPAQAATGDNFVLGTANTAGATTKLTAGDATQPALRLENAVAGGAPDAILFATSYAGRDIAGRLSVKLDRQGARITSVEV